MSNNKTFKDNQGNLIILGEQISNPHCEGTVFAVKNEPKLVAKIYHEDILKKHNVSQKIETMCNIFDSEVAKYAALPQRVLYNSENKVSGFLMERINDFRDIYYLYQIDYKRKYFDFANYAFIVHAALNLAIAFDSIHSKNIIVGDINQGNIMVNDKAFIKLIDCDSYQFEYNNKVYMCEVGTHDYTSPELLKTKKEYREMGVRTKNHDYFGLAVIIFQILMFAQHPYAGFGAPEGDIKNSILSDCYCYGKNSKSVKKNTASLLFDNLLTDRIKELFERAFSNQTNPIRPTAAEWIYALEELEGYLVPCPNDPKHVYNSQSGKCIWCELKQKKYAPFNVVSKPKKPKKILNIQTPDQNKLYSSNSSSQSNMSNYGNYTNSSFSNYSGTPATQQQPPKVNPVLKYFVIITVVIFLAFLISNNGSNSNKNNPSWTSTSQHNGNYPTCDADSTLKPMKRERTAKLKPLLENSQYELNANYSLWYRNTISDGNGYCESEEMIKNLFWADPNVYIAHPINYSVSYDSNGNTVTNYDDYDDLDSLINNSDFYNDSRKLTQQEVKSLLKDSLPDNSNNSSSSNYNPSNRSSSSTNNNSAAVNDPDFGPYMRELQRRIKINWDPPKGDESKRVVVLFKIAKDGSLQSCRVLQSSGVPAADQAALQAVEATAPFNPLPADFKGKSIDIQFTFDYNVFKRN